MSEVKLSPPWQTYRKQILFTFGQSHLIKVNELVETSKGNDLKIEVLDEEVAKALREVLPLEKDLGSVKVFVTIIDKSGNIINKSNQLYTPEILASTFCKALKHNKLYKGIKIIQGGSGFNVLGDVVVIIDKQVVQFFNDDIGNICGNYNEVAAKVFGDISERSFTGNINVSFSTFDKDCTYTKELYCPKKKYLVKATDNLYAYNENNSEEWHTYRNKVRYTFALCKFIKVCNLEQVTGGYNLKIIVCKDIIAKALREILPLEKVFETTKVFIIIINKCGKILTKSNQVYTPKILADTFCAAMCSNPLYRGIMVMKDKNNFANVDLAILVENKGIQFYNDNEEDVYGNYNELAANVFNEIIEEYFAGGLRAEFFNYDPNNLRNGCLYCVTKASYRFACSCKN